MKKVMAVAVTGVLMAGCVGGCQGGSAAGGDISGVASDIKMQAAEELKKAFSSEVMDFFRSDDLSKTLGVDSEEQVKLEESIKAYIDNYSMDEEKLSEAKASLDALLESAEGLSVEEIQDRVSRIFASE